MLEEERHTSIKQFEEIAPHTHIVDKRVFFCSPKPCHSQQELRIIDCTFCKQHSRSILYLAILDHCKLVEQRPCRLCRCRWRHAPLFDTICHSTLYPSNVQVLEMQRVWSLALPCKATGITAPEPLFKHRARHQFGRTLHFVESTPIVSVRSITKFGTISMYTYHIAVLTSRHFNNLHWQTDGRLYLRHLMSHLPLCTIRYALAQNLQIWSNAEEQPPTICIQKSAQRLHALHQLASGLLQLQHTVLITFYDNLYLIYCHILPAKLRFSFHISFVSSFFLLSSFDCCPMPSAPGK